MQDQRSPPARQVLAIGVLSEGGLGLLAVAVAWWFQWPLASAVQWEPQAVALGLAASLPLVAVLVLTRRYPWGPLGGLKQVMDDVVVPMFAECNWLDFLTISILAGVGEELLFRGLLQAALVRWTNPAVGLLLASVLFGLAHPLTPGYAVLAGLFGLLLGGLFLASDNLLVAIVAHAAYDFFALVYLVRRPAGDNSSG